MTIKERVKAEIDTLSDEQVDELYGLLQEVKKPKKSSNFFDVALSLKLDGPPDFSERIEEYLYGDFDVDALEEGQAT